MNERIKELVEQTHLFDNYEMVGGEQTKVYGFTYAGITTFAELIVRECARVSIDSEINSSGDFREGIAQSIQQHFGIEK